MAAPTRASIPRKAKSRVNYADALGIGWVPGTRSTSEIGDLLDTLNAQTFKHATFGLADDLLVATLCGSKKRKQRWNALLPARSYSRATSVNLADLHIAEQITKACADCRILTHPEQSQPALNLESIVQECMDRLRKYEVFQRNDPNWDKTLKQYVQ